jgi:hypothetical protein
MKNYILAAFFIVSSCFLSSCFWVKVKTHPHGAPPGQVKKAMRQSTGTHPGKGKVTPDGYKGNGKK